MFSSDFQAWSTPQWLFDKLNNEFHFTLDACADSSNHKCRKYYNIATNGLAQSWENEVVWINPEYKHVKEWVNKAHDEVLHNDNTVAVMLIPARPETKVFCEVIVPHAAEIRFLKGRLKFSGHANSAPFPSCIVVFTKFPRMGEKVSWVDYRV